jgi:hypothetical protein
MSDLVPIYRHTAKNPWRFYYDTSSHAPDFEWSIGEVAFYAYSEPVRPLRLGWMGYLQSNNMDKRLTEITIPGTHDTGTWKVVAETASKCQDMDLWEQLNHGIRFIDIRLYPGENNGQSDLAVWHGSTPGYVWFSDVVKTCRKFFEDHPTETIIMSIKKEGGTDADYPAFRNALNPFLQNEKIGGHELFYRATLCQSSARQRERSSSFGATKTLVAQALMRERIGRMTM